MAYELDLSGKAVKCRVKKGWSRVGDVGIYFAHFVGLGDNTVWALVLFDGDEDPGLMKAASIELEISEPKWVSI